MQIMQDRIMHSMKIVIVKIMKIVKSMQNG